MPCVLILAKRYCSDDPNYCEYEEGDDDTNIIVSVPHGGTHKPDNIPDRVAGCYVNDTCIYTHDCVDITNGTRRDNIKCSYFSQQDFMAKNTSLELTRQIELVTGKRSHLIVSNLHRTKLDVNREIQEAALGIKEAEIAWKSFHSFIKLAKQKLNRKPGIIFDIHTQSHSAASLEIGYAIPSNKLNKNILHMENSSIYSLGKRLQNRTDFEELIYGNISLGRFTEDMGIETIPSPRKRSPGNLSYFPGGYIIRKHGSKKRGKVDAIQLESSLQNQLAENFKNYTTSLAKAVVKFVKINYECNGDKKN